MFFDLSRILLWLIVSVLIAFKIKKSKIVQKKLVSFLAILLCLILVSASAMFPVENLFVNFKSPESVFNYANGGEINDVIYGKESCMVIYTNRDSSGSQYIIPKTEKGYKIPGYFTAEKVSGKFDKDGSFDVYNVSGTEDYYLIGSIFSDSKEQNIVDSRNNPVENIVINMGDTETKVIIVYSYIENFDNDYYLIINGVKTPITE